MINDSLDLKLKQIGHNLRKVREAAGISQENLSQIAELDRTYISGLERGVRNPSLKSLFAIKKALKVSWAEIFKDC